MFYEGDLQSGISLAIQQVKSVVCFVRGAYLLHCGFAPLPECRSYSSLGDPPQLQS